MGKQINKKWYNSRTIWGLLAAIMSGVANWAGLINDPVMVLIASVSTAIAVYGRAVAQGPLK